MKEIILINEILIKNKLKNGTKTDRKYEVFKESLKSWKKVSFRTIIKFSEDFNTVVRPKKIKIQPIIGCWLKTPTTESDVRDCPLILITE